MSHISAHSPRASVARSVLVRLALPALFVAALPPSLHAQGWLQKAKDKAKQAVEETKKPAASQPEAKHDSSSTSSAAASGTPGAPGAAPTTNVGNDFTPGTRVLMATDFKRDELGDFPRELELKSGNMEVADIGGTRYLRATSNGEFVIHLPETLPKQFTMEFDFTAGRVVYEQIYFLPTYTGDTKRIEIRPGDGGVTGSDYNVTSGMAKIGDDVPFPVKIMADGNYVKVYMNGTRVANAPNADLGRSNIIRIKMYGEAKAPVLIGNIRIAAGGKDLYRALATDGRVTAEGILFDTNSDRIRPESAPALKEIGDMLAAHPDVRVAIEGHTDNVGNAAANLSLSDKRAAAVKAYLSSTFGVAADRLTSKGYGATKPAASNDTPDGRAKNRRVELVKIN